MTAALRRWLVAFERTVAAQFPRHSPEERADIVAHLVAAAAATLVGLYLAGISSR